MFTCTSVRCSSCLSHSVTDLALALLLKPLQLVHLDSWIHGHTQTGGRWYLYIQTWKSVCFHAALGSRLIRITGCPEFQVTSGRFSKAQLTEFTCLPLALPPSSLGKTNTCRVPVTVEVRVGGRGGGSDSRVKMKPQETHRQQGSAKTLEVQ